MSPCGHFSSLAPNIEEGDGQLPNSRFQDEPQVHKPVGGINVATPIRLFIIQPMANLDPVQNYHKYDVETLKLKSILCLSVFEMNGLFAYL